MTYRFTDTDETRILAAITRVTSGPAYDPRHENANPGLRMEARHAVAGRNLTPFSAEENKFIDDAILVALAVAIARAIPRDESAWACQLLHDLPAAQVLDPDAENLRYGDVNGLNTIAMTRGEAFILHNDRVYIVTPTGPLSTTTTRGDLA